MPEPTSCQEVQLLKSKNPHGCHDPVNSMQKLEFAKLHDHKPRNLPEVECNPITPCMGKYPETKDGRAPEAADKKEYGAGDSVENAEKNLRDPEDSVAGPLGPIPCDAAGRSAPPEYWAPLADLTKSRPAVENLSITRYTPAEWHLHNRRLLKDSHDSVRKELLASYKAHRCMEHVFAQTDRDQQDNDIKLDARLGLVGRWKVELQRELDEFPREINAIQEERKRLLRCSHAVNLIESVNQDVKKVRNLRIDPELVRDEVEDELSNEWDLCADVKNVYTRCLDQVQMQLQELKDAKRRLEMDLTDKKEAWNIDVTCRSFNSTSSTLEWKSGSAQMPPDQSTPTSYEDYCKEAIVMSQTALQRSRILRANLHNIYEKSVHDLRSQADCVDVAIAKKIDELVQTCRRIENELHQCLKALADAEVLVEKIRAGIKRLDGAMKCAQNRLDLRLHRKKVENCRDVPQFGLIDEVKTLSEDVSAMLSQIENTNAAIDDLTKARQKLEKDLIAKRKSLWVDRERSQVLRSFYPTIQILAGH